MAVEDDSEVSDDRSSEWDVRGRVVVVGSSGVERASPPPLLLEEAAVEMAVLTLEDGVVKAIVCLRCCAVLSFGGAVDGRVVSLLSLLEISTDSSPSNTDPTAPVMADGFAVVALLITPAPSLATSGSVNTTCSSTLAYQELT